MHQSKVTWQSGREYGGQGRGNLKNKLRFLVAVELQDACISVVEALKHSGYVNMIKVKSHCDHTNDAQQRNASLSDADGIIGKQEVFGQRYGRKTKPSVTWKWYPNKAAPAMGNAKFDLWSSLLVTFSLKVQNFVQNLHQIQKYPYHWYHAIRLQKLKIMWKPFRLGTFLIHLLETWF